MSLFSHERQVHHLTVAGKAISCPQCGGTTFISSSARLLAPGLTFHHLEWLGQTVHILLCDTCSHIQWFGKEPQQTGAA
jgi:uncharacterized protein